MNRIPVNPWPWSLQFGYNQAEIVEEGTRQLICAGQTAVDGNGAPQHPGEMRAQMELALDNLEAVLRAADMDLTNIVKLDIYATDVDQLMQNFDVIGARLGMAGVMPPQTVLGVTRLALPPLMFEISATAVC